jgi:Protein of unknown function (DUF1579)
MLCKNVIVPTITVLALVAGSIAIAQTSKDTKPTTPAKAVQPAGGHGEMQLPPGWTSADMQACMVAGTPGEHHAGLARGVGTWAGKTEMWMAPGMPSMKSECESTVKSIMDGRYVQIENKGEMPGMGMFQGMGVNGFDNVSGKFVSTWIDNHSTGIMVGTGELSKDGKVLTWNCTYNCPINKKPAIMRQVETFTSDTTMTLEMFGTDPKSGKEFKMMKIDFTKKS